mgnify:CR=1 FL=1
METTVALVTGAASGIGRATALEFSKNGSSVVVADTSEPGGAETARMITSLGGKALFVRCDVSRDLEVKALVEKTIEAYGRLDFAFNNAGTEGIQGVTQDCSEENWNRVIDVNLKGVWLCMKYQIPVMLKQKRGSIVNCSSIAGLIGFPGVPAYVASKHGVIGLTKTAALECARSGIRINAVCPGLIQTPMIDRFTHGEAQIAQQLAAGEPVGRMGRPEEVAGAVLWLSSPSASFVTGHSLAVDGGWVAQ